MYLKSGFLVVIVESPALLSALSLSCYPRKSEHPRLISQGKFQRNSQHSASVNSCLYTSEDAVKTIGQQNVVFKSAI